MTRSMTEHGAVAIDLGATSGRFAKGWIENDRIRFDIVEQEPHSAVEIDGRLTWNLETLLGICRRAVECASQSYTDSSVGIDSWGVDHGFLDSSGRLLQPVVCYRDTSHLRQFEKYRDRQPWLYGLTGIQHQPFNTVYQLLARKEEEPSLPHQAAHMLVLPDLLGYLLSGTKDYELTHCSTTQLLDLNGRWSREIFDWIGWNCPESQPQLPGGQSSLPDSAVSLVKVGGHDTASAVCGLGTLSDDQVFLNVGTWSLLGCLLDQPLASPEADTANFTNERAVDGRVRFLANIPGFYVINRIHDELGIAESTADWLSKADFNVGETVGLMHQRFFNPDSMIEAFSQELRRKPQTIGEWAGAALTSLATTTSSQITELEKLTGRSIRSIRAAGGGSSSSAFCQVLSNLSKRPVIAGPSEATVMGNLGVQFLARGIVGSFGELSAMIDRSIELRTFEPE